MKRAPDRWPSPPSGHLAYALGGVHPALHEIAVRVTSAGDTVSFDLGLRDYTWFRVSPDGDRLAFADHGILRTQLWVRDLTRGVTHRMNTGGYADSSMEWSPDGRSLAFSSDRDQVARNIYRPELDGSGEPERLAPSERPQQLLSWSSQDVIAYREAGDIWVLPPDGSSKPFFTSEYFESNAAFSPDGQWLAYVSNQNGPRSIYVRRYPGPGPAADRDRRGRERESGLVA